MSQRRLYLQAKYSRTAFVPPQEMVELGIASVPRPENEPVKERKRRTKLEQETNPYETRIQKKIVKDLRTLLLPHYIVQARCEHQTPEEKLRAFLMGEDPGWPDIGVYGDGRTWQIECKDRDGDLNKNQKIMHRRIIAAGIPLLSICRDSVTAIEWLKANGARFRRFE